MTMSDIHGETDPTLPSITDGITDTAAEASAIYDLTIDEVRALNSANYKADYKAYVPPAIARMKRQHAEALDGVEAERDELLAANKLLQTKLDLLGGFGNAADDAALRVVQRRDASIERLTARVRQLHDARRTVEAERDELRDLLGSIWLYVDWRQVTKQLTTPQKDLWADVVDANVGPGMVSPGEAWRPVADRWWRDDD